MFNTNTLSQTAVNSVNNAIDNSKPVIANAINDINTARKNVIDQFIATGAAYRLAAGEALSAADLDLGLAVQNILVSTGIKPVITPDQKASNMAISGIQSLWGYVTKTAQLIWAGVCAACKWLVGGLSTAFSSTKSLVMGNKLVTSLFGRFTSIKADKAAAQAA